MEAQNEDSGAFSISWDCSLYPQRLLGGVRRVFKCTAVEEAVVRVVSAAVAYGDTLHNVSCTVIV